MKSKSQAERQEKLIRSYKDVGLKLLQVLCHPSDIVKIREQAKDLPETRECFDKLWDNRRNNDNR